MISKVSVANNNGIKKNPSFSQQPEYVIYKRPSKAKRMAVYTASQFTAGAMFSLLLDATKNVFNTIAKKPNILPIKGMMANAATTGVIFTVFSLLLDASFSLFNKLANKNK